MKKEIIEKIKLFIEEDNIYEAKKYVEKYELEYGDITVEICSIKSIIYIKENKIAYALEAIKKGLEIEAFNIDLLYNLAYLKFLQGDIKDSYKYYLDCYINCEDENLIVEIQDILNQLRFNIEKNNMDFIIIYIDEKSDRPKIIENEMNHVYKMNFEKFHDLVSKNYLENIFAYVVFNQFKYINHLKSLNIYGNLVYNCKKNLHLEKDDYLDETSNIYNEVICFGEVDFIITDDIKIYTLKKLLENSKKIYFLPSINEKEKKLQHLILDILNSNNNISNLDEKYFEKEYYLKKIYYIVQKEEINEEDIKHIKEIYNKFKDEFIFKIYIGMLLKLENLDACITVLKESNFIEDKYIKELIYLQEIGNKEKIKFIINLSLNNYSAIVDDIYLNDYYKIGNLYYTLGYLEESFENYKKTLIYQEELSDSVIVNQNLRFLRTKI